MEFRPVGRDPGAFQQSVTEDQVLAMCRRAFGDQTQPVSAVELGLGSYNSTYRVDLGADRTVILRVAPEPGRQTRAERSLMRNEHASVPYLAPIAALMPRTLMVRRGARGSTRSFTWPPSGSKSTAAQVSQTGSATATRPSATW